MQVILAHQAAARQMDAQPGDAGAKTTVFLRGDVELSPDLERLRFAWGSLPEDTAVEELERLRGRGRDDYPVDAGMKIRLFKSQKTLQRKSLTPNNAIDRSRGSARIHALKGRSSVKSALSGAKVNIRPG